MNDEHFLGLGLPQSVDPFQCLPKEIHIHCRLEDHSIMAAMVQQIRGMADGIGRLVVIGSELPVVFIDDMVLKPVIGVTQIIDKVTHILYR